MHLPRRLPAKAREVPVADVAVVFLQRALAGAPRGTARGAPRGLVHQPLVRVELLLAAGEYECVAAVAAGDLLVSKSQVKRTPSSASEAGCESSVAQGPSPARGPSLAAGSLRRGRLLSSKPARRRRW